MVLRNDLLRMSGGWERSPFDLGGGVSLGDSYDVRPPLLDLVLHVTFACKLFLDRPQYICFLCWRCSHPSPIRVSNKQNKEN
jgi:hypothetical protein